MRSVDSRRYEMFDRLRSFGEAHAERFAHSPMAAVAFASLTVAVERLKDHTTSQRVGLGNSRSGTTVRGNARAALRAEIDAVVRAARGIALDDPPLAAAFRAPGPLPDRMLIATARTFATQAAPRAAAFVEYGLPASFLADLEARASALEQAITDQSRQRIAYVSAGAAIAKTIADATRAVRRLDAIVPNVLRGDNVMMALWESARRVEYPAVRRRRKPQGPEAMPDAAAE